MLFTAVTLALLGQALASALDLEERQSSCPNIHVFGARETTAPAGYGSSSTVVNLILNAYPGSTSEAISYPACGGQSSCGGVSYANSVVAGINAVASAVNTFNQKCPQTQLVLVGYSQGGQIMDNALCGGGDPNQGYTNTAVALSASAVNMVKAAIFMGDPRFIAGLSYEVGTCKVAGFDPRPPGFNCPSGSKIQSYCDAADPYCCNGNDANTHQGYGSVYGQAALTFVKSKLSSSSSGGGSGGGSVGTGGTIARYGQCGGQGWTGATSCQSQYTCTAVSQWYSQCL
ncbi:putative acetyl xylan esterase (Axe1) [Aspergillus clavatus NRRL 1]|uniref:Acetyl xylan esterase (Axe1), putative n=1 Tax=Aspergillus clavatus (strain ATCC 1007 / CBS 513.65 / DSM 816 / NCTC 3887 / NRRL 1 / QM 1276 / 107) TaxID=344612 RepID=A1CD34_ASPCL|nr:acetyl xylan esterase (Axe1), putative [Aspergillus clavatus NRRL 1]EAW12441.1 acetyl xylan esterase (Axe1), putative [Aspergillus clavatus NRRL 1]